MHSYKHNLISFLWSDKEERFLDARAAHEAIKSLISTNKMTIHDEKQKICFHSKQNIIFSLTT